MVDVIRGADPLRRPISSGHAWPRADAASARQAIAANADLPDAGTAPAPSSSSAGTAAPAPAPAPADNAPSQVQSSILLQGAYTDIISIQLMGSDLPSVAGLPPRNATSLVALAAAAARAAGKQLIVSAFGDSSLADRSWSGDVIAAMRALGHSQLPLAILGSWGDDPWLSAYGYGQGASVVPERAPDSGLIAQIAGFNAEAVFCPSPTPSAAPSASYSASAAASQSVSLSGTATPASSASASAGAAGGGPPSGATGGDAADVGDGTGASGAAGGASGADSRDMSAGARAGLGAAVGAFAFIGLAVLAVFAWRHAARRSGRGVLRGRSDSTRDRAAWGSKRSSASSAADARHLQSESGVAVKVNPLRVRSEDNGAADIATSISSSAGTTSASHLVNATEPLPASAASAASSATFSSVPLSPAAASTGPPNVIARHALHHHAHVSARAILLGADAVAAHHAAATTSISSVADSFDPASVRRDRVSRASITTSFAPMQAPGAASSRSGHNNVRGTSV